MKIGKRVLSVFLVSCIFLSLLPTFTLAAQSITPMISGGLFHSVALKSDGTVWAWGDNSNGQLGVDTVSNLTVPVQIPSLTDVVCVSSQETHSLAVKRDGTVWAWGANGSGQLGDGIPSGINTYSAVPIQVKGLSDIVSVSAGNGYSLALRHDGTVWAWGVNYYGQLGNGKIEESNTPVQVMGLANVTQISAGGSHSLAIKDDGTVWAWGRNTYGALGNGNMPTQSNEYSSSPIQVPDLKEVISISAGGSHSLAITSDGTVWSWGDNAHGQLGDGTLIASRTPLKVPTLTNVISIAAGYSHSMALKSDGTVYSWGTNADGQLGNGTTADSSTVMQVTSLSNITTLSVGWYHSFAIKSNGTLLAWGNNGNGQLATSKAQKNYLIPTQTTGLSNGIVPTFASSFPHFLASENEWEVLKIVNQERIKAGKQALSMTIAIQAAAELRTNELLTTLPTSYDTHTRPDGRDFSTILNDLSIPGYASENNAGGQYTAIEVMTDWMQSETHKENLLRDSHQHIGIGYIGGINRLWEQLFVYSSNNSFSNLKLYDNQSSTINLLYGSTLTELNLVLECTSSVYGTCYLPLIDEMCTGFDSSKLGTQMVTVNYQGLSFPLEISVTSDVFNVYAEGHATDSVSGFSDVKESDYYAEAVQWAVEQGITTGTSKTTFSPDNTCDTSQILTFLWRAEGSPQPTIVNPIANLSDSQFYYTAVLWAYEEGLISGTIFEANEPCTRSMVVYYLWNLAGMPSEGENSFTDVPLQADYAQAVAWAVSEDITNGTSDDMFSPNMVCTRGQIVTFLYRNYCM